MPGFMMGRTMRQRVVYSPAPSMVEASISSKGTVVCRKVRMMIILKGLTNMGTIRAA